MGELFDKNELFPGQLHHHLVRAHQRQPRDQRQGEFRDGPGI